ncbi:putative dihydrofolate reductase [Hafnia phage vB_HpaM_SarahDanielle]|uniref:dihydrofolate reductase n=1 Tax=Hafnia phage vB_HpaM_SarahDanielle TaxID=2836113 RepID=A0AAE7WCH9_9CAUD|nr:putative dihydrofolate reductase [Hafnia phage vB_HpaM_SarahDanielle]
MTIKAIFATDSVGTFGVGSKLPWPKNKEDMLYFKNMTMNTIVVMGYNTWQSIGEKPLTDRVNVVVTTGLGLTTGEMKMVEVDGECVIFIKPYSLEAAVRWLESPENVCTNSDRRGTTNTIFVIGGKSLLIQLAHVFDEVYHTEIFGDYSDKASFDEVTINGHELSHITENLNAAFFRYLPDGSGKVTAYTK